MRRRGHRAGRRWYHGDDGRWQASDGCTISGGPVCVPADGTVGEGGACTWVAGGWDDCLPGLFCNTGVCVPFCSYPGTPCPSGHCPSWDPGDICTLPCDPLAPVCAADEGCFLSPFGDPGCELAGPGGSGAACTWAHDCAAGFTCALDHHCAPICEVGATGHTACGPGESCVPWQPGTPYGICGPPP